MRTFSAGLVAVFLIPQILFLVQEKHRDPISRAKRPKFEKTEGVFFNNLFEEALVGERPKNLGSAGPPKIVKNGTPSSGDNSSAPSGDSYPWSKLISASAIEDEVKAIKIDLDKAVTTPTKFASGDSKIARVDYSILAMLFAIVSEYDGEVKWKKHSAGARDAFAKCAANASTSTEQAYQQAKQRKQDLGDMLSGGSVSFDGGGDEKNDWSKICDRTPLMQRLKTSYFDVLKPGTANAGEFKSNVESIAREASLVAAIGEVLTQEGMEDGDDESYASHAKLMKQGALDILEAIKLDNVEQASKAVGVIDQSCSKCHEDWR